MRTLAGVAVVALAALAACAGSSVRTQTEGTATLIATARENGAQRCAPVELAMAESHNDFASHSLDVGNYYDAKRDAEIAKANAEAATQAARDRWQGCRGRQLPVSSTGD